MLKFCYKCPYCGDKAETCADVDYITEAINCTITCNSEVGCNNDFFIRDFRQDNNGRLWVKSEAIKYDGYIECNNKQSQSLV